MARILSISGLRGIIADGLDPAYVAEFAAAVGTWAGGGTVIVSQDGRPTGPMLRHAVLSGLMSVGCRVLDLGIAATPTCGVLVAEQKAAAGLQITASHNPAEWNGLKPFGPDGAVFNAEAGQQLLDILELRRFAYRPWDGIGPVETLENAGDAHLNKVRRLIDVDRIRARRFRVVVDCNHGSGGVLGPVLLRSLGCEEIVLGGEPDGRFAHPPEPLEQNLTSLCDAVRKHNADAGFAQDPDADRLAIVDNTGRYIGEELTLALCVDHVLATREGPVVVNASTSRVTADVAAKHGCDIHRSHVGEANVVAKMRDVNAVIGGEGNGGVIEPAVGWVRDSFMGIAYVLDGLAARETPLSAWVDSLPKYVIVKDKLACPREAVPAACAALKAAATSQGFLEIPGMCTIDEGDGLRLDWPDRWVQVRGSNTEPIVRVIAEAPEAEAARELCRRALELVRKATNS